ncbi:ATP-grasp ribosomal peptide maturase [Streptomyces sp. JB150]|uniref:ATP-grasp ribosomal peptide maturase n=1 Tax=Streptomyces sp. JB150 TaxID=2714844 RepID=UPI00140A070D|nr:ATP-grasp ribosomal peptide maturase [Streptomyces sp. JB150]QIJ62940.1 ATP-grasp ribosomal peptide maturase [Streptomyces sp. JB150]
MAKKGSVLVVTEPHDVTADLVISHLNQRAVPVARFNPADIGAGLSIAARFDTYPARITGQLRTLSRSVALDEVRAIYWRRPVWPVFDRLPDADARFAQAQVRYGLGGFLYALRGCWWVNHPLRNAAADYKPAQLALAHSFGLRVPPTLVTNDPDEARRFIREHGRVIYKALRWTSYARDGVSLTTWTEPVSAEELDDTVRVAPHLFQARVDKIADLRVLIVGRRVFAVRITSGLLDWRTDYAGLRYDVVDLPDRLSRTLRAYLDHYGLASGSFDLAVDREGEYHWLELNPNGQWAWLEEETGLEMAAAFADLLIEGEAHAVA